MNDHFQDDEFMSAEEDLENLIEHLWDDEWLMMFGANWDMVNDLRDEETNAPPMTEKEAVDEAIQTEGHGRERRVLVCAKCGSPDIRFRAGDDLEYCWECGSLETVWISYPEDDLSDIPF